MFFDDDFNRRFDAINPASHDAAQYDKIACFPTSSLFQVKIYQ